ncbi:type II secretion system GspH family protein [Patescibacteria group bacterium]|nr:type II secretion system GspH family protein [Patescibacteria group bacterium]
MNARVKNKKGFTLLETLLYSVIFSIVIATTLSTTYTLLQYAQSQEINSATEQETLFILSKIKYALSKGITQPSDIEGIIPSSDNMSGESTLSIEGVFTFMLSSTTLLYSEETEPLGPLNSSRVAITNFKALHIFSEIDNKRFMVISFTANGNAIEPFVYQFHF